MRSPVFGERIGLQGMDVRLSTSPYEVLINQQKPTNPITEDLDVGWRLALASKLMNFLVGSISS